MHRSVHYSFHPWLIALVFLLFGNALFAQSISGYIQNEQNQPVPFAHIFLKEVQVGTTANEEGYYFLTLEPGDYEVAISALGYESKTIVLIVDNEPVRKDIWLTASDVELEQIVVKASKRDPAYAIIQKAIDNKDKYVRQVESFRTEVYVKATEEIDNKKKKKKKAKKDTPNKKTDDTPAPDADPFAEAEQKRKAAIPDLNMIEMQMTLNFQYPKRYKEERSAYKAYGDKDGLFIPRFGESDFNFYRNLVFLKGVAEVPVISPLSRTAILSYKFKLVESVEEDGLLVHKIKVIPRKKGDATCRGHIYINEGLWNINRLDLSFSKGALKFFDAFRLKQDHQQLADNTWMVFRLEMIYQTKIGKHKTFRGNTLLRYADYETNYPFPPKFFGNEVAVTTKEAYERDSSYWKDARPEPLSLEEQRLVAFRDSVDAILNSKAYKDSVQALYNKITFMDLIWDGVGFRNHLKKRAIYFGPIPSLIDFEVVGGFRVGPFSSYFKRWESGRSLSVFGQVNIGLQNKDLQGFANTRYRYQPMRLADVFMSGGRSFQSINSYDAYINQLKTSNYILHDYFSLGHRIELFNGFYFRTDFDFHDRKSVENYISETFLDNVIESDAIHSFTPYQAFISNISLSYTPGQKFMTEPNRKIVLGSKWPTFTLHHQKGWPDLFSSDIDHDFVDLTIEQELQIGIAGQSRYRIQTGTFLNTSGLEFIDYKRFRQSDPWLYSNPLHSFQLLDTSLAVTKFFFEAHHIHHFNGALINNIPLVRKLRVHVVGGAGFLWVNENKLRHEEIFAGLERTFKIGPRRRLRLGAYGVLANSNYTDPKFGYKFSIDIIDTWKRDWSF